MTLIRMTSAATSSCINVIIEVVGIVRQMATLQIVLWRGKSAVLPLLVMLLPPPIMLMPFMMSQCRSHFGPSESEVLHLGTQLAKNNSIKNISQRSSGSKNISFLYSGGKSEPKNTWKYFLSNHISYRCTFITLELNRFFLIVHLMTLVDGRWLFLICSCPLFRSYGVHLHRQHHSVMRSVAKPVGCA